MADRTIEECVRDAYLWTACHHNLWKIAYEWVTEKNATTDYIAVDGWCGLHGASHECKEEMVKPGQGRVIINTVILGFWEISASKKILLKMN